MQQQIDLIGFKFVPIQYSNPKTSKLQIITFMLQIRTSRLLFEPIGFTFEPYVVDLKSENSELFPEQHLLRPPYILVPWLLSCSCAAGSVWMRGSLDRL